MIFTVFVVILSSFQDSKNKKTDLWFKQPIEAHLIVSQYYCCRVEAKGQQDFNCTNKAERFWNAELVPFLLNSWKQARLSWQKFMKIQMLRSERRSAAGEGLPAEFLKPKVHSGRLENTSEWITALYKPSSHKLRSCLFLQVLQLNKFLK